MAQSIRDKFKKKGLLRTPKIIKTEIHIPVPPPTDDPSCTIKYALNKVMEIRGMSAYKLSKMTGISQDAIGMYRKGKRTPRLNNLRKIADALDVPMDFLIDNRKDFTVKNDI